jgi:SPP1 gp7 family putative phage head morphogenesis protein
MTLVTEIDALIETIAARLPASMEKPENKRRERAFRKSMAEYFNLMAEKFPYGELDNIYKAKVKEVAPPRPVPPSSEWDAWLDAVIKTFQADLTSRLVAHIGNLYIAGSIQMMSYGKTKLGIPILFEGPPMSQAVNWARDYGAGLVTNMDIETRSQLANIISQGIENKRGVDGLARDIRKTFTDMSRDRADMIAQTESNRALSEGAMQKMQDMGVDGKEWIVIGDDATCEICQGNTDQGVIPLDEPFQSGDMNTPGHPRCRCATSPANLSRND